MTALNRKLWRDLAGMKSQAIAIGLVVAAGVATFVMSLSTTTALDRMRQSYYDRHHFADVFAHLKRAPDALGRRLKEIPGVAAVETRAVVDVTLDIEGMADTATGRLISIPDRQRPQLNELYLRAGRYLESGQPGEVIANEAFADENELKPGDELTAVINGRRQRLRIVGVGLSPEYVYSIRPGDVWPDNRRFGVLWMGETELSAAYDLEGAFNDLCLTLSPGGSEQEVIRRVDALTAPYGGQGAYGRGDQISHRYLSDESKQLRAMSWVAPVICLVVAASLLNIVLTRLLNLQRGEIATLKAFGYGAGEIGWHYFKLAMLIATGGILLGLVAGGRFGNDLTRLYGSFFRFPQVDFSLDAEVIGAALGLGWIAVLGGVFTALRGAMRLPPAEAMRPEPPDRYRPLWVERLGWERWFAQTTRMILRRLERRPWRALLSCLGIALAIALLTLGNFSKDLVDYVSELQFYTSQRQDLTVAFVEPTGIRGLREVEHLPGVLRAEPFRTVPVRLRLEHRSRRVSLLGIEPGADLFRLVDLKHRQVTLPPEGLVLALQLAEQLGARRGEAITVEVLEGTRPVRRVVLAEVMEDFAGSGVGYMDRTALNRLMREGSLVSGAFLATDQARLRELHAALKETPRVASVGSQRAAKESFMEMMSGNILRMRLLNVAFACVIAFGVVYNTARVTLSEQNRELATLRVMGMTRGEISRILLGEIAVLTLVAIPLGLILGHGFSALAVAVLQTETQRFPLVIAPSTYSFAVAVVLIATLVSSLVVRARLDRLDLVAVLKARE